MWWLTDWYKTSELLQEEVSAENDLAQHFSVPTTQSIAIKTLTRRIVNNEVWQDTNKNINNLYIYNIVDLKNF